MTSRARSLKSTGDFSGTCFFTSDRIREMIINRRPTSEIKKVAREEGMITLRESGMAKVRIGATTLREINKVTFIE